jgi:hypothetical protein
MSKKRDQLAPDTIVMRYTGAGMGGGLPGVPLADLTLDQWNQIPVWQRPSVTAHADYAKAVDVPLEGEAHPQPKGSGVLEAYEQAVKKADATQSDQPTDQPAA